MSNFKKFLSVSLFSLGAIGVMVLLLSYTANLRNHKDPNNYFFQGKIVDVVLKPRLMTVEDGDGRRVLIGVLASTEIFDEKGRSTVLSSLARGSKVKIKGALAKDNTFLPSEIRVIRQ